MTRAITQSDANTSVNSIRIDQNQNTITSITRKVENSSDRIELLATDRTKTFERLEQLKESRDKIGQRVGQLENKVSEMMGWKRLIISIFGIGAIGIGALIKSLIDSIL